MKLAFICHGSASASNGDTLEYLQPSCHAVEEALTDNGWKCINKGITSLQKYQEYLFNYKNETITEYMFYFIGHGNYTNILDFHILLEDEEIAPYLEHIVDRTYKSFNTRPKKIAIVIDACYSGQVINVDFVNKGLHKYIEILTSSSDGNKSYETKDFNDGRTVFSHFFCEAVNLGKTSLSEIKEYIAHDIEEVEIHKGTEYQRVIPLTPYYNEAQEKEKIVVGYNKEINSLRKILLSKCDEDEFKQKIMGYYASNLPSFKLLKKENSFIDLFNIVVKYERRCLYCLFKELNLEIPSFFEKEKDNNCQNMKEEAQKSRIVNRVILEVNDKSRTIRGWLSLDSQKSAPMTIVEGVNFDKKESENYFLKVLNSYLSDELQGMHYRVPMELQVMLYSSLFKMDSEFKQLKMSMRDERGYAPYEEEDWSVYFNISYRFLENIDNYEFDFFIDSWKENSEVYTKQLSHTIEDSHIYRIEKEESRDTLDGFNNDGNLMVLSDYRLLDDIYLKRVLQFGIPTVFSPSKLEQDCINSIEFKQEKVSKMKQTLHLFTRRTKKSTHLIDDNYYDLDFLTNQNDDI
jgi:hypothetical protein